MVAPSIHHLPDNSLTVAAVAPDSFTVSLHSTYGTCLPVIRVAEEDCQWPG